MGVKVSSHKIFLTSHFKFKIFNLFANGIDFLYMKLIVWNLLFQLHLKSQFILKFVKKFLDFRGIIVTWAIPF